MGRLLPLAVILVMTLCSKFLRSLAFGRSDSIALEVSICCFLYALMDGLRRASDLSVFLHGELMRCAVLLFLAFVIAAVHKYNKDLCMAQVDRLTEQRKTALAFLGRAHKADEESSLEEVVLDHTGLLARASIDVWYSQFVDKIFYDVLKRADKGELKSFRKKKTLVRWAFADLLNAMKIPLSPEGEDGEDADFCDLDDKSFNIPNARQIVSMVIFDSMALLSILIAIRVI